MSRASRGARWPALRRPVIGVAVMFLSGVAAGLVCDVWTPAPLILAWMFLLLFLCSSRHWIGRVFLFSSILLVGWVHADMYGRKPSPREMTRQMQRPREFVTVRGVISADPIGEAGPRRGEANWRFPLRVDSLDRLGYPQRASGTVDVRWRRVPADTVLRYGQYWELSGVITDRTRIGVHRMTQHPCELWVAGNDARLISSGHGTPFVSFCYRMRKHSWSILGRGLEEFPEHAGIVRALLLGYRHEVPDEHHRLFAATGTLHIFAISGLHVGVVALLLIALLKFIGLSRHHWVYGVAPLLVVYTVATGMRASALRACVMALVYWSAFLFRRKPDAPSALAWAAVLIVAAVPTQLAAPGFIYSFVIVAGLLRLYPIFSIPAVSLLESDAWYMRRGTGWKGRIRLISLWGLGLMATSVAAWLSSAPLTAHYFNRFSPIALVGNLVVIPAAFLVVMTSCLSLVTGTVWPILAEIFNHANRLFLSVLLRFIECLAEIPYGHSYVASPHWIWIAVWYGILFGGLVIRSGRIRNGALCGVLLLGAIVGCNRFADRTVVLDVLETNDGHATLIQVSRSFTVLYDAGPRHGSWRLVRHLRQQGVNRLDVLVLSTPIAPYIGGAIYLMDAIPVGEIWMPPQEGRSAVYQAVLDEAMQRSIPIRKLQAGDRGRWSNVEWEILHPSNASPVRRAADAALVMRIAREGQSVMLMGGGGEIAELNILSAHVDPASPILIYGNQGASGTAAEAWIDAVGPSDVVMSVGPGSRTGYPDEEVLERLRERGLTLWRTDRDGVVRVRLTGSALGRRPARDYRVVVNAVPAQ